MRAIASQTLRPTEHYAGKKDSRVYPELLIEIEAKDGQLEEKRKLWDALLNSFKPVAKL